MEHRSPIQNRSTDRFHAHTSPEYRHTESQRARHPATSTTSSIHSHEPFGLFAEKPPIHSTDNHDRHRSPHPSHPVRHASHPSAHTFCRGVPPGTPMSCGCPPAPSWTARGQFVAESHCAYPGLADQKILRRDRERGQAPTASPAPRRGPSYPPPTPQTLPQPRSLLNYTTRVKRQRSTPTPCAHAWT